MLQILHNPRCQKSREALALLEKSHQDFEIIMYMQNGLTADELKAIIKKLNITPLELLRKNETIWKEKYKHQQMDDEAIITAMVQHPNLIERPIVIKNKKAVIARPAENINSLL